MSNKTVEIRMMLDGSLLEQRRRMWERYQTAPHENPLIPDLTGKLSGEGERVTFQNDLCVYSQLEPQYAEGLLYSGIIVTKRPCETVFDLTPAEAAAVHALLHEVRAYLDATVKPDGYTVGWNVYPAGGQHIPHVHLHVIPRWNGDAAAGAGVRYFLKAVAQASAAQSLPLSSHPPARSSS